MCTSYSTCILWTKGLSCEDSTTLLLVVEAEEDLASRFYVGDLLSSGREEPAAQPVWSGHTTAMISLSVVVACCSYLFGGTLLGSLVALCVIGTGISLALTTQQTTFQQLEHAYTCNGCNYKQIAVLRYKCG